MNCIEIICLYLKKYMSKEQFQDIFYDNINDFQNILQEDIYLNILSTNFVSKQETISLETELCTYILKNHSSIYDKINDAYIEYLIDSNKRNAVIDILKKRYEKREKIFIDCTNISTQSKLIYSVKKALNYPQTCGNNWDAVEDFIFDIIFPQKLIFYNWHCLEEKLPQNTAILKSILNKVSNERCIIIYA